MVPLEILCYSARMTDFQRKRTQSIHVRVTTEERDQIERTAKLLGYSSAPELMRALTLEKTVQVGIRVEKRGSFG